MKSLVKRAGRYNMRVAYRSMLLRRLAPFSVQDLPVLWMDSPAIWSEPVRLDIHQ